MFYFVLEFVGGGDLRFHLDRKMEFTFEQIRFYIAEIVIALKTLHKLGVIYRDLKPENILIDMNGHLKLADFGLSRKMDRANTERRNSLCGTFEYLAPEMLRDDQQTFAVDWWALGILVFRLHFGYLPYRNLNMRRLFEMILENEVKIPRNADPVVAEFIRELLIKEPEQRLGSPGKEITRHPYFEGVSWQKVAKMEFEPQFVPGIVRPEVIENFDEMYTKKEVVGDGEMDPESEMMIEDFSFENSSKLSSIISFEELDRFENEE